jgi:uncharacterized protein
MLTNKSKKTLVVGASTNPQRYAYKAIVSLRNHHQDVVAFGLKKGAVEDVEIVDDFPIFEKNIDTITLYIGAKNQEEYYQSIIDLNPNRVIFNPGTENHEFYTLLKEKNIYFEEACTLVKLSIGDY